MKSKLLLIAALTSLSVPVANAQDISDPAAGLSALSAADRVILPPNAPQGWSSSYQQESSRDYLRRRAQEKTEARQARIEGMRWLGYSPSRPTVSTTPFTRHTTSWGTFGVGTVWHQPYWFGVTAP